MFSLSHMTTSRCMLSLTRTKVSTRVMHVGYNSNRKKILSTGMMKMHNTVFRQESCSVPPSCRQVVIASPSRNHHRQITRNYSGTVSRSNHDNKSNTSARQLWTVFKYSAVPMLGFGFMDNTIMIQAGNFIDCTIGVWFGLSTLAAAACGQIVSAGASVMFGNALERAAKAVGILPSAKHMPSLKKAGPIVQRVSLAGSLVGVVFGATLGLINLYWIDTKQSTQLKLEALSTKQEFAFEVQVSNNERKDATTVRVKGPDVDGILASLTATLTSHGYSLVELHAHPRSDDTHSSSGVGNSIMGLEDPIMEDVFVIRPRKGEGGAKQQQQVNDVDLENLGKIVLAACKDPLSAHSLKQQVSSLQEVNSKLMARIWVLENAVEQNQIEIIPSDYVSDESDQNQSGDVSVAT